MSRNVVIVGAGQAAVQAVATLRAEGFYGSVTIIGDELHLPYQRPPLSKKFLMREIGRDRLELKPREFFTENGVTLLLGQRATQIDRAARRVLLSEGGGVAYDQLLLATGARVRRVNLPGSDLTNIFYLRNIADAEAIQTAMKPGVKLVLVGGGYIGLEVAAVASKSGCDVTVLEMADRVMNRVVSAQVSAFFAETHQKAGVNLCVNTRVDGFIGRDGLVTAVQLIDGRTVAADLVIIGVGVEPETDLAQRAGIVCTNGISVDAFGQTSDPDIFAAGDCTSHPNDFAGGTIRLESVQNAIDQAKHAALAMLGRPTPYQEVPWFWSDQYDLKLQIAGLRAEGDALVVRGDPARRSFSVFYLRGEGGAGQITAVESVNAPADHMIGRKLIDGQTVAAPERLADVTVPLKSLLTN